MSRRARDVAASLETLNRRVRAHVLATALPTDIVHAALVHPDRVRRALRVIARRPSAVRVRFQREREIRVDFTKPGTPNGVVLGPGFSMGRVVWREATSA